MTPRTSAEATELLTVAPDELPWPEMAFWSTEAAFRDAIAAPPSARPGR